MTGCEKHTPLGVNHHWADRNYWYSRCKHCGVVLRQAIEPPADAAQPGREWWEAEPVADAEDFEAEILAKDIKESDEV